VSQKPIRPRPVRIESSYHRYLLSESAPPFIAEVSRHYSQETLMRLAVAGNRVTRRAATLALGFLGDYSANEVMAGRLKDPDRAVRLLAEHGLREIWFRAGNQHQYQALKVLVRLNDNGQYHEAVDRAIDLLRDAPKLAEAWNQRAIAEFSLCDYEESVRSCQKALQLNVYHYNAAMGLGHGSLQLEDPVLALDAFRLALEINPNLECVRSQIRQLERAMDRERLDD
jgi:tetratricopeptide (TPR) repeat protein